MAGPRTHINPERVESQIIQPLSGLKVVDAHLPRVSPGVIKIKPLQGLRMGLNMLYGNKSREVWS